MGLRVNYSFPSFTSDANRSLIETNSQAVILREHQFDVAPRFLFAMFLPDEPGILMRVLSLLHKPLSLDSTGSTRVTFSIEGSITSAVSGSFLLAFVIRAVSGDPLPPEAHKEIVRGLEKAAIEMFAEKLVEEDADLSERFSVLEFRAKDDRIFESSNFTEYMLTASPGARDANAALGETLARIANSAGMQRVPIAYAYFPISDETGGGERARIAIATPGDVSLSMPIDWDAIRAAADHQLLLQKYEPDGNVPDLDQRFRVVEDFRESRVGAVRPSAVAPSRAIFVTGPARVGFVADMLRNGVGQRLTGGTMTVVGGHTIACWVCPESIGEELQDQIRANCGHETVAGRLVPPPNNSSDPTFGDCWLAWKVPDESGVFLTLVKTFEDLVAKELGEYAKVDYTYSITRVIAGSVCAGKVHLRLMGPMSCEPDELSAKLQNGVRDSDFWKSKYGKFASSSDAYVSVSPKEPGEEPWAQLVPVISFGI